MRPGRGLIDQEVYDELIKIPGARRVVVNNVTNHRFDHKTGKLRVEISEEAWPEVKLMVINLKRFKAGRPQLRFLPATRKSATQATPAVATVSKTKFRKGMKVDRSLTGAGVTTHEEGVVLSVSKGQVWLDCGPGNDPDGPFDAITGDCCRYEVPGFHSRIAPFEETK